jgi:hypothetical protein
MTFNGLLESANAMQCHVKTANDQSFSEISSPHQCPCTPAEQQKNNDCCDICFDCACHAPLTVQHFKLSYNPSILDIQTSDPFKFLPEVYLSKFIPPQQQA